MLQTGVQTDCCVVGAGPAGAILALLLARQGVRVTLLEAHTDFERDFRGDTLHPSTLALMDQLGLIDRLLQIPHGTIKRFVLHTRSGDVTLRPPGDPRSRYPHVLMLPQARFLELLIAEAQRYPEFHLILGARAETLIDEQGIIRGVRYRDQSGCHELRAVLTVGADGRFSKIRQLAGFEAVGNTQPIDVLWFRLPRLATDAADADGIYAGQGVAMAMLGRPTEWQLAFWIPKSGYQDLRSAGLEHLRRSVTSVVPWLGDRTTALQDWQQMAVLTVESSRVKRWHRPGVLLIGDAAHVMSPVGGVGINFAIQDAVVASNILGPGLKEGVVRNRDLAAVQRRREWPTRLIQRIQGTMMQQLLAAAEIGGTVTARMPIGLRLVQRLPILSMLRDRLFAYGGFRPEPVRHIRARRNGHDH
jgi:2-polyprenyl-6-methoxyphenol hydroxylase-like FAD-dependent oxidoreductase